MIVISQFSRQVFLSLGGGVLSILLKTVYVCLSFHQALWLYFVFIHFSVSAQQQFTVSPVWQVILLNKLDIFVNITKVWHRKSLKITNFCSAMNKSLSLEYAQDTIACAHTCIISPWHILREFVCLTGP